MTDKILVAQKSFTKVPNQKAAKWPNCFSSSSLIEQSMTSLFFYNFEALQGARNRSLNNHDFIWDASFFICMHAYLKDCLATT